MKQKKNPRFRFSGSIDMEIIRRQVKRHRRSVLGQWTIRIVVAAMIVTGTYLVIENQTYTSVATADSHKKDTEDISHIDHHITAIHVTKFNKTANQYGFLFFIFSHSPVCSTFYNIFTGSYTMLRFIPYLSQYW